MMRRFIRIPQPVLQLLFLLSLTSFVFTLYFTYAGYNSLAGLRAAPIPQSITGNSNVGGSFAQNIQITPEIIDVDLSKPTLANNTVGNGAGSVLAATSGCTELNPQGCVSDTIAPQPVCTRLDASIDLEGGNGIQNGDVVTVRKNSFIEVWKVTSPLAIFSGIEAPVDSTKAITKDNPVFRSAYDFVEEDLNAGVLVAPGEDRDNIAQTYDSTSKGEFSVNVQAAFGSGGTFSDEPDKATIFKELPSKCEEIQPSTPNPSGSNSPAQDLMNITRAPGDYAKPRNYQSDECVFIDPRDIDLPNADVYETCVNSRSLFDGIIGAQLTLSQWGQCIGDPTQCEQVAIVGLLIDAPMGSNRVCNEDFCLDQYQDGMVASKLDPLRISEYADDTIEPDGETLIKPLYITTPCQIRVDRKKIYKIPCMWDVSSYWNQYLLEAAGRPPNDPTFPKWDEYWEGVIDLAERRGQQCNF